MTGIITRGDSVITAQAALAGERDHETFLDHYQGRFSPEAQKRERQKVDWL